MARSFSGTGQDLNLGSATALELTGDLTWSARVRTTDTSSNTIMGCYLIGGSFTGWGVGMGYGGGGLMSVWTSGHGSWQASTNTVNSGAWRAVGLTFDSTTGTFYRDGTADGTFTVGAHGASGADKRIAADSTGSDAWIGDLAEVAVWGVALTAAEMAVLADGYSPLFIRPASLVAYWPIIGRTSPEQDLWKNNLAGTVTGSPGVTDHPPVLLPRTRQLYSMPTAAAPATLVKRLLMLGVGA